jgi:hypothetical protein
MGEPKSWIDAHFPRSTVELPRTRERLVAFVSNRIRWEENGLGPEAREHHDKPAGQVVYRYAQTMRSMFDVQRRAVARYAAAVDADAPAEVQAALRAAVVDIAAQWRGHPGWDDSWDQ